VDSRYNKYLRLAENTYFKRLGKVVKIVGLTIESVGPDAKLNDLCRIIIDENADSDLSSARTRTGGPVRKQSAWR
jgi:flagellum-specific ATP synthase